MKILHFADLHLGVESYGKTDSNGLSTRLHDFLNTLDKLVDFALESKIDLVLFCGDAYKSREPTQTQQREFAKRIKRLSAAGIPTFLLVGNHDMPNAIGRATTTEIFDTLAVQNVYVSNRPDINRVPTSNGLVQIVSLPWLRRSALLSREDMRNLNLDQLNQKAQQMLTDIIASNVARLNPKLPAILAAHVWVAGAKVGSEKSMVIGQEHTLLTSNVANPAFDYVALGHIHKHQVLSQSPPVVYAGSLERLDFSDEDNEKGFYLVEIEPDKEPGKRKVSFEFHALDVRRFLSIEVNVDSKDSDPTTTVLKAIFEPKERLKDAIVRLNIILPAELGGHLRDNEIKEALKESHYFTIAKDIQREIRSRLGNLSAEEITPLDALKAYLESKKTPADRARVLLEYGERMIKEQGQVEGG